MPRILVVEDEPLIALMASDWLAELGHEPVGPARTVAEALALADATIDGAIVDLTLGRECGYDVAAALAQRNVPFVFASGHAETERDPAFPASSWLAKPYDFEAFQRAVEGLCQAPSNASAAR